jgi:uncharacterized protein
MLNPIQSVAPAPSALPLPAYLAPTLLRNGFAMTLYAAFRASRHWEATLTDPAPTYQEHIFTGAQGVPIFGKIAIPPHPKGTIVATYGITGDLDNQWLLQILGRKAYARGYAIVLFDWRGHGKTAELSPTLTADGLYEGEDFVRIAAAAKNLGCPGQFWVMGYSLGGQLALWAVKKAQEVENWGPELGIRSADFAGGAVICPSLDSIRSLSYLVQAPLGKQIEKAISRELKKLALRLHRLHPGVFDIDAIHRANSIWGFDHELVIGRLGFASVEDYYNASSALQLLPSLEKPTLILYAADDPLFDPVLVPELAAIGAQNSALDVRITAHGGHVGYVSSPAGQRRCGDADRWWAWNRILDWCDAQPVS